MSKPCCFVIALLLAVFTFNQVALSYALTSEDRSEFCDPLETEAGNTAETIELKLKEVNAFAPVLVAFIEPRCTSRFCKVCDEITEGIAPHGNHVPIYIDERVLRI
jgi:hypothetical protein